uniref:Sushi domain-containing protein n=1 Tax=Tetraodon nigroviridis TaxID=99883 RepID=H3D461_TETNG
MRNFSLLAGLVLWLTMDVSSLLGELICPLPVIENGRLLQQAKEYRENDVLHFSCNRGFRRTEDRPSKCTKVGMRAEWSPMPECEPAKCRVELPPLEGTTYASTLKNVYYPGETLNVTCGEGFWISSPQDTFAETTCDDDGQWTIRPVCQEFFCSNQREYNVRWWNVWRNQQIRLGDTARYQCVTGYKSPDGSNVAKCTRNGWEPKPLCQEITCPRLEVENAIHPDVYKQSYRNDDWVTYRCMEGFTGRPTRTCGQNGWTGDSQCTVNQKPGFLAVSYQKPFLQSPQIGLMLVWQCSP